MIYVWGPLFIVVALLRGYSPQRSHYFAMAVLAWFSFGTFLASAFCLSQCLIDFNHKQYQRMIIVGIFGLLLSSAILGLWAFLLVNF